MQGCKSGVTVHYVDEGMDTGPIIAQQEVVLDEQETRESFKKEFTKLNIIYIQKFYRDYFKNRLALFKSL